MKVVRLLFNRLLSLEGERSSVDPPWDADSTLSAVGLAIGVVVISCCRGNLSSTGLLERENESEEKREHNLPNLS